uniref:HSA domain-containing protein n=1 Tax=Aegilops tauschii subsp. strangulata TaxID=200361 RepID=A0A453TAN3_AEGTS
TRPRRKKALEAPREPRKPKVHWDHVLGEMVWLSKEFESERKWKLSMAKKIAQRANMGVVDQATKDEKKQKVLYKNQLEVEERKKKALDKQLDFLLGQTERYSTMLAENLVDVPHLQTQENGLLQTNVLSQEEVAGPSQTNQPSQEEVAGPSQTNQPSQEEVAEENINAPTPDDLVADTMETDDDYDSSSLNEEQEDDERTIDEDEAQITEAERNEELAALQAEADIPIDDLLKSYLKSQDSSNQVNGCNHDSGYTSSDEGNFSEEVDDSHHYAEFVKRNHGKSNGGISGEQEDNDYVCTDEGKDDEATLSEEEELAKKDGPDPSDEVISYISQ